MAASHRKRRSDTMEVFDSPHISKFIENGDIESKRAWLQSTAQSLQDTYTRKVKMAERRENTGVLFPQQNKKNERSPDYKGEIKVGNHLIKISGWTKHSAYGSLISLMVDNNRGRLSKSILKKSNLKTMTRTFHFSHIYIAVPAQYEYVLAQLSGSYGSVSGRSAIQSERLEGGFGTKSTEVWGEYA
jgi:hypothetical protein